jgi:hypothetical protein
MCRRGSDQLADRARWRDHLSSIYRKLGVAVGRNPLSVRSLATYRVRGDTSVWIRASWGSPAVLILASARSGLGLDGGWQAAWKYIRLCPTGTTMTCE